MKNRTFRWNEEKNKTLKRARNISFEEVVATIQERGVLQIIPNTSKTIPDNIALSVVLKIISIWFPILRREIASSSKQYIQVGNIKN